MDKWVPLFQALVWPAFWLLLLVVARRPIRDFLRTVEDRVAQGAPIEAGTSGIKLGAIPTPPVVPPPGALASELVANAAAPTSDRASVSELSPSGFYLIHTARRDRASDRAELKYYRIRIFLDADVPSELDKVAKVVYILHPTFTQPVRESTDRASAFELVTVAWGEFNVGAIVHFKDGQTMQLSRYLNL